MNRALRIAGWGYVAVCVTLVADVLRRPADAPAAAVKPSPASPAVVTQAGAPAGSVWFRRVRPYCNPVEAQVVIRDIPAPPTTEGQGYLAACYSLAGRIDDARRVIDALPKGARAQAAGIVFEVGHPVADGGDDRSAGPIMELVIDYWPNHYMALYHAGMAEYMLGQHALARKNLLAFLEIYKAGDGWVSNAREVLARIDDPKGRGRDLRRPREPGR